MLNYILHDDQYKNKMSQSQITLSVLSLNRDSHQHKKLTIHSTTFDQFFEIKQAENLRLNFQLRFKKICIKKIGLNFRIKK